MKTRTVGFFIVIGIACCLSCKTKSVHKDGVKIARSLAT